MSYILEALKKSDRARKRGEVPGLNDPHPPAHPPSSERATPWIWITAGTAAVLLVGIVLSTIWVWQPTTKPQPKPQPIKPQTSKAPPKSVVKKVLTPSLVVQKPAPVAKPLRTKIKPKSAPPATAQTQATQPKRPALPALKNANAYVARAWSNLNKGGYVLALADLKRATTREPGNAEAWFARGWTHEKMGMEPTAMTDYTRAIDAKPDYAAALFSRGYLRLYSGDEQGAVVDFVRTQGVAKDKSLRNYSRLWLYISRIRAGQDAKTPLFDDIRTINLTQWPGPLIGYILGRTNETTVVEAIEKETPKSTPTRKEKRVTGYYFLAMIDLLSGEPKRARTYFEKALATGAVDFRQYDAAKRELNAMRDTK